jgi:hypothetical protein
MGWHPALNAADAQEELTSARLLRFSGSDTFLLTMRGGRARLTGLKTTRATEPIMTNTNYTVCKIIGNSEKVVHEDYSYLSAQEFCEVAASVPDNRGSIYMIRYLGKALKIFTYRDGRVTRLAA